MLRRLRIESVRGSWHQAHRQAHGARTARQPCARLRSAGRAISRTGCCRSPAKCSATASPRAAASVISPRICEALSLPTRAKHQPAVKPEEFPALLRAIDGYEQVGDKLTALALRLLALTFVRTGELIGATWDEIDLDNAVWIIPAARMKMKTEHVVPLSNAGGRAAASSAGHRRRQSLCASGPQSRQADEQQHDVVRALSHRLQGPHDRPRLPRVASTILNETGKFRPDVIERQLAHCERNEIRGAYNRAEYLPERRKMMQRGPKCSTAMKNGAQVIPLQRRA